MAELNVSADLFKFIALRSPENIDHENDTIHFIRDYRLKDTREIGETPNIEKEEQHFVKSNVAHTVFNMLKEYAGEDTQNQSIVSVNRTIAEYIKDQYGLREKIDRPWIEKFSSTIQRHLTHFDKKQLIEELNQILKDEFPNKSGIKDYVEDASSEKISSFSMDFDDLFERLYVLYVCKRIYPVNLEYMIEGLKALHVMRILLLDSECRKLSKIDADPSSPDSKIKSTFMQLTNNRKIEIPKKTIETKEDLAEVYGATVSIHRMFAYLLGYYKPFNPIKPVGVGDLLIVKQFLCKYESGEIAHVENVLNGENKERTHRRLDRWEDTFITENEQSDYSEQESQTTSRFELGVETENTIQEDINADLSASVSGKYGVVEYSASAGISYHQSKSDSIRSASNFSRDVVNRSLNRVQKKVREERTQKKIFEIEDINKHILSNVDGKDNITGIYCWLDKHYKAQIFNYGKRLMFEFIIPEPAAFIKKAFEHNQKKSDLPVKPTKPVFPTLVINQITEEVAQNYVDDYNISDIEPIPAATKTVSQVIQMSGQPYSTREFYVTIPEGYEVDEVVAAGFRRRQVNVSAGLFVTIGHEYKLLGGNEEAFVHTNFEETYTKEKVKGIIDKLGIAVANYGVEEYAFTVTAKLSLLPEKLKEWQIKTYGKIMAAYEKKLAEYKSELYDYEENKASYEESLDTTISGLNSKINQDIINTELKKHCITMITKQFDSDKSDDIDFGTMNFRHEQVNGQGIDIPAININETRKTVPLIQFLEQAFEWPQISYLLYPYFWGEFPEKWFEAQTYFEEADPVYAKFLQAGSARVLVAVRPAYETAVLHYLYTQEPWNGGIAPGISDPLYTPIYEELRNQQDDLHGATPYGKPWPVVVPTSLVYLQKGSELPTYDCNSNINPS